LGNHFRGYFTTLLVSQTISRRIVVWQMNELETIWEEVVVAYLTHSPDIFLEEASETIKHHRLSLAQAEIRNEYISQIITARSTCSGFGSRLYV
jgi:hypothetical protein